MSKEIKWKKEFLNSNTSMNVTEYELHDQLFLPRATDIQEYMAEAIKAEDFSFRYLYTERDSWDVLSHIVKSQLPRSKGIINLKYLKDAIDENIKIIDRMKFFIWWDSTRFDNLEADPNDFIFAEGELLEDYTDYDSDPYVTAGGYRKWTALKGTKVRYLLSRDLTVFASFESNCVEDHYNNNFGGVSTGGGTTKYKIGERKGRRGVDSLEPDFLEGKISDKHEGFKASVNKVATNHLYKIINDFQNALWSAVNNK